MLITIKETDAPKPIHKSWDKYKCLGCAVEQGSPNLESGLSKTCVDSDFYGVNKYTIDDHDYLEYNGLCRCKLIDEISVLDHDLVNS